MKREIYAISLLLSFLVVFSHMMVPHHHHESFTVDYSSKLNQQEVHSHPHNGKPHHSHDDEENDNQSEENSDHSFPQHFHISATEDFYLTKINHQGTSKISQEIQYVIISDLFLRKVLVPPEIPSNTNFDFGIPSQTQYKPGANGLRGPPSIG